jgi:hypothetical protein
MIFQITDELIDRFLKFLIADQTPLPADEFPMVTTASMAAKAMTA